MFRQIITPNNTQLILQLPDEFVGHQVEVIAFTVENTEYTFNANLSPEKRNARLMRFISNNPIILPEGYKFNREELYG